MEGHFGYVDGGYQGMFLLTSTLTQDNELVRLLEDFRDWY